MNIKQLTPSDVLDAFRKWQAERGESGGQYYPNDIENFYDTVLAGTTIVPEYEFAVLKRDEGIKRLTSEIKWTSDYDDMRDVAMDMIGCVFLPRRRNEK